jgi:SAM-dependent methyltransferase
VNRAVNASVRVFAETFDPPGPVIELGSLYLPGWERLSDLRGYFPGREYIGCDMRQGLGVDRIEDAENLSFADASAGTVLLIDMLPHTPHPQHVVAEAGRILRDDGILVASAAFNFRMNGFPTDYYRFTASGLDTLLESFEARRVFSLGPLVKPRFAFAVAAKRSTRAFTEALPLFERRIRDTFRHTRRRAHVNEMVSAGRDLVSCLVGRARLGVAFYDPDARGGYLDDAVVRPGTSDSDGT